MSLNHDQFRQILVGDNASEYGDRQNQHKDRQIQDGDQAVSCQAALNNGRNDQTGTGDLSASQKKLVSDVVKSNMVTKKGEQISAYPKMSADKVSHDQRGTRQFD